MSAAGDNRGPVLVLAPADGDAEALDHVLTLGGFRVQAFADVVSFAGSLTEEIGAVIVAEEALTMSGGAEKLAAALAKQPDWSDLPVILLARQGANEDTAWALARGFEGVGNITILERPLRRSTLLNAVSVALRSRERQYELRAHRQDLEAMVTERTAELAESMRQLHAKERLAALGTLAAGLGHDIANLVLPVRIRLDSLVAACTAGDAREDVTAIGTALNYLTNLSVGLRLMALDPSLEAGSGMVEDLSRWWAEVHGVLRGVLPRHVRFEGDLPAGVGVRVPAHRLTQAVFNLVQNAGEALAETPEGAVRISAEKHASVGGADMVRLRIADNGPGMTPDVMRRCFEPYFSTKGRAISTGMGLGMVRGLVESVAGTVEVKSEPGQETTFTLTLPAAYPSHAGVKVEAAGAGGKTAALSVSEPRVEAVAVMLLKGLELKIVRPPGSAPTESVVWVAQDPPGLWVEDFLQRCPAGRVVVLRSDSVNGRAGGGDHAAQHHAADQAEFLHEHVTVLPLSTPPSILRKTLIAAVRDEAVAGGAGTG